MDHYFTDNRHLAENRKEISFRFWCFNYSFMTDNGVFSKGGIDEGTKLLLTMIVRRKKLGPHALDMGCGYGPIGITLANMFPDTIVEMVDINPRAIFLAKENAQRNKVQATIYESNVYDRVKGNTFSDIICNPPIRAGKAIVYTMFEGAYDHLAHEGVLWVVIRKQQGAKSAIVKIKEVFHNCEVIHKEKGYFILKAKKELTI